MIYSERVSVTLDFNRTPTEFTGDDVDQFTELISLNKPYEKLIIEVPTIESSTVQVHTQWDDSISTVPSPLHEQGSVDSTTILWATTAGTGGYTIVCDAGLVQHFRLRCGTDQTADRVFYVRGARS